MPLNAFKPFREYMMCVCVCVYRYVSGKQVCAFTSYACNNYRVSLSVSCQFECHSRQGESKVSKVVLVHAKDERAQMRLSETGNGMAKNK